MNIHKLIFALDSIKVVFSSKNNEIFNQVRNNGNTIPAPKSILYEGRWNTGTYQIANNCSTNVE